MCKPETIGEEDEQHHANAKDRCRNDRQNKTHALKFEMHEICQDQRRLDQRQSYENRNHQMNFHPLIGQEDFEHRQQQKPYPDLQKQLCTAYRMIPVKFRTRVHYGLLKSLGIYAQQIQHRENEHPDQVNKMPVQAAYLDMIGRPLALVEAPADGCKVENTDGDVKHVQPGEPEESSSEQRDAWIPGIRPRGRALM